jgi:hypothetical protein
MVVFDFNSFLDFGQNAFASTLKGLAKALRTNRLLTTAGLSAKAPIRRLCPPISRQSSSSDVFLFRPVSLHDVCTDNISPELTRHRNMSASDAVKAVSLRHSRQGVPQHAGKGKRASRLAHLCGFRAGISRQSEDALRQRRFRRPVRPGRLRPRFDNHRFVFDTVPMGKIPSAQGRRQDAYAYGPSRLYTVFYLHYRWFYARCKHSRRARTGVGCVIHNGSRLPRLRPSVYFYSKSLLLYHAGKKQLSLYPNCLSPGRQEHRPSQRPDDTTCYQRVSAGGHCQERTCYRAKSWRNPANSQHFAFRANADRTSTYEQYDAKRF